MTTILAFVFVLGVLVFVHELGHFLAAKRVGIRVLKFQLGFNPTILSFRRGDTEYSIGALPLGGYVKMAGESPEDARTGARRRVPVEDQVGAVPGADHGAGDEPAAGVRAHRGRALSAAPKCRVYEDQPPVVGVGRRGLAGRAGRHPAGRSDRVGRRPPRRHVGSSSSSRSGREPNREVVDRACCATACELTRTVTPTRAAGQSRFEIGDIGVLPNVHPHLPSVSPASPATRAGLKAGDVILAVDGQPITFAYAVAARRSRSIPSSRSRSSILRDGAPQTHHGRRRRKNGRVG